MNMERIIDPINILLVDDDPDDVRLTQEAFKDAKFRNSLDVLLAGEEVLPYLRRQGKHQNAPRPDLILLDLNLPKKDGRDILKEIKTDPNLKSIPVVILTSSTAEKDIAATYNLHANCFVTKPVDFDQFIKVVKNIENFWLSIVKLPPKNLS